MSENKNYKIIRTTTSDVIFTIHPVSNPILTRLVHLTEANPVQPVPLDWALGVFADDGPYSLYKNRCFTFDDNDSIVEEAFKAGVYFDDKLDFVPATPDFTSRIFEILKGGNREKILNAIEEDGEDAVKAVAISKVNDLTQAVIRMLENIFKIQLTVDGE